MDRNNHRINSGIALFWHWAVLAGLPLLTRLFTASIPIIYEIRVSCRSKARPRIHDSYSIFVFTTISSLYYGPAADFSKIKNGTILTALPMPLLRITRYSLRRYSTG